MADGLDPRTPVIIGTGHLNQRVDRGAEVLEPVDLMAEALRIAEADTGSSGVLARADSVRVLCELSWRYADPGALVAERLGASPRHTLYTVMGGNYGRSGRRRPGDRGRGLALAHRGPLGRRRAGLDDAARGHPTHRAAG